MIEIKINLFSSQSNATKARNHETQADIHVHATAAHKDIVSRYWATAFIRGPQNCASIIIIECSKSKPSSITIIALLPSHLVQASQSLVKMAQDPREYMQRLQRAIQQRQSAGFGGGGMPGGGAAGRGIFGLIALGVGATILSNSLFNVDGGHRAIKYTRIGMSTMYEMSTEVKLISSRWCQERNLR